VNRHLRFTAGFSLVEVTLALGIAAFCLITIFGLLPVGIQTNQNAISQTAAASILSSVVADLRATPKANPTSSSYEITFGTAKLLYLDSEGRSVSPTDPNSNPRYRSAITFQTDSTGDFAPTAASLKISWPALVDPATTAPIGFVETFAAFDRH
jgi:uncharacterized protein (TIGR02598 family)